MTEFGFEIITSAEFQKAKLRDRTKVDPATLPRTLTNWLSLATHQDFCTCPSHEEVQRMINQDPEKQEYRQRYPTRYVIEIGDMMVCRDCWMAEADK